MSSLYFEIIQSATKCEPQEVAKIEQIMRDTVFHSTLDWQTRKQLEKGAKTAFKILKQEIE